MQESGTNKYSLWSSSTNNERFTFAITNIQHMAASLLGFRIMISVSRKI